MAEEGDAGCQPQVRSFLLCLAEAGLHHTICQEGNQKMMGETKVMSEMARILLLLFLWDVASPSEPASILALLV